ncbi:MAG: hypothetical protein EXR48_04400 [Dehalococcoidia bacterium]|nr:hypothetical protein [Dehalococcoidia bacterium]
MPEQQQPQHTSNGHHHRPDILRKTHQQVTEEVLAQTFRTSGRFWLIAAVLAALLALGIVGFSIRAADGTDDRLPWGYFAAALGYLLTTAMAAPIISVVPRLARAHWGRPLSRIAELWGIVGVLATLMLIPLLFVLPSAADRNSIWFVNAVREGWPPGAPHAWLLAAMIMLAVLGLALVWVSALPDFATARDHSRGQRKVWYTRLSMGWEGTHRQWKVLRTTLSVLGPLYLMNLVFFHFLYSSDFAQSFVPGWKDSIFPAWQAISAFQSALATVVVTMFVLRTWGGLKDYIFLEQFWALGKLMLPFSIFWFYFWFSGFMTYWYGRTPAEHAVLTLMFFGGEQYRNIFITAFVMNFVLPLFLLIWNPIRRSILGPTVVACLILTGTLFDRIRLYVASFSVPNAQINDHVLNPVPTAHFPGAADVFILIGAVAGAILLFVLASRFVPVMNMWEAKEALVLQRIRVFHRTELKVLGKPE